MASFTVERKGAWATAASTGALGTPRETKTGTPSVDAKWKTIRAQVARAFIADPDCFFAQMLLASNRQYGAALELKDLATSLVQYAEGALYPSLATPTLPTAPEYLAGAVSVEGVNETADILAQRATAAAAKSKIGRRLAERGDEAAALYLGRIDSFVQKYFSFQTAVSCLADAVPDFEPLRQLALTDVQASSDEAAAAQYKPASAAEFAVQNAAAAAALRTVNRVPNIQTRLSYTQVFTPANVEVSVSGTTITFTTQSPAYCYLRVGDVFSWAGGETTITAVGTSTATLATDVGSPATYAVAPSSYSALTALQKACASFLAAQEVADKGFRAAVGDLSSPQRVRDTIFLLATIQNGITGVSPEVEETLTRLGLPDPPTTSAISSALYTYAPALPSGTKETTKSCLALLQREGFQLASQRFLVGDLTFLSEESDSQQLSGLFTAVSENRL